MKKDICLPAEWADQDAVMLTWPHAGTDWAAILEEAETTYISIAREILKRQALLIVCDDPSRVASHFSAAELQSVRFFELPFNDTWARDHGPIITFYEGRTMVNDFGFNGWGNKFDARLDDRITSGLFSKQAFKEEAGYLDCRDFILEGGSIESDGLGTLMTTGACLLNPNRNPELSQADIEDKLRNILGAERILWVMHGHLEGDDTDSHIDTLARFCDESTIAYVQCIDPADSHFGELQRMEQELKSFRQTSGEPYRLVPLPMVSPLYNEDGERMGATYANFLIINHAVLVPVYGTPEDRKALGILSGIFPGREVVGINCLPLIKQNGSLHCITMQIPKGVLL